MGNISSPKSRGFLLSICYLGFISLGLPDTLIGVAWPSVRGEFGLRQSAVSWVFFGSGCSYFLSSFFAGRLLKIFNVGVLLGLSSGLVAVAGFNYSFAPVWPWFACGALLHGLGSGAIDSGLNHYVASHFPARHMNWLHASYSLGAMLGPILMTTCIAWRDWRAGYFIVAVTLFALALLFMVTKRSWGDGEDQIAAGSGSEVEVPISTAEPPHMPLPEKVAESVTAGAVLRNRIVQLQIVVFFIYTGLEVALGQWSFTVLTESRGIDAKVAGAWVSVFWGSILAGRIIFGFIVDRVDIDRLIRMSLVAAVAGTVLFAWNPLVGVMPVAPVALAVAGLGLAVIFPCLMTRTPQRVGKEIAGHAIGFQVGAAMLGAAALPSVCGVIAQRGGVGWVAPAILGMAVVLFFVHEALLFMAGGRAENRGD